MRKKVSEMQVSKARIMKALGHPTRIYMLENIAERKICVCAMAKNLGISFAAASKHFSVLKNASLVEEEREGNNVYYRLVNKCVLDIIKFAGNTVECIIKKRLREIGKIS